MSSPGRPRQYGPRISTHIQFEPYLLEKVEEYCEKLNVNKNEIFNLLIAQADEAMLKEMRETQRENKELKEIIKEMEGQIRLLAKQLEVRNPKIIKKGLEFCDKCGKPYLPSKNYPHEKYCQANSESPREQLCHRPSPGKIDHPNQSGEGLTLQKQGGAEA